MAEVQPEVVLYVDDSTASHQVQGFLEREGIVYTLDRTVDRESTLPALRVGMRVFEGPSDIWLYFLSRRANSPR